VQQPRYKLNRHFQRNDVKFLIERRVFPLVYDQQLSFCSSSGRKHPE